MFKISIKQKNEKYLFNLTGAKVKTMKRKLLNLIMCTILSSMAILLNSCAMAEITLGAKYQRMPSGQSGSERVIDKVAMNGQTTSTSSREGTPSAPSPQRLGGTYKVLEKQGSQRHRHETILDQLLGQAQRNYPNEAIDIRNATMRYRHIGSRTERGSYKNREGQTIHFSTNYSDFQIFYDADVIIAEPVPHPPSHSVEIPLIGVSRADLYRRAHNWLTDTQGNAVRISLADFDRGRLQGEYDIVITHGLTYLITSTFTIDVHDERADIRFENPRLQRNSSRQFEPIFLQSIANRVQTEMGIFSENLKHSTSSR